MSVCVRERERMRESDGQSGRGRERQRVREREKNKVIHEERQGEEARRSQELCLILDLATPNINT